MDTGRAESHGSESIEPEHTDADSESGNRLPDEPPAPVRPLPVRFILSADQMVARNPLLRPVRKRVLGVATSLSKTFVQLSTAPPGRFRSLRFDPSQDRIGDLEELECRNGPLGRSVTLPRIAAERWLAMAPPGQFAEDQRHTLS